MTRQQTRTRTPQRKAGRKTPASRRKSPASRRTGVASRRKSPARRKSSTRKTKPKHKSHQKKQSLRHGFHRMLSGGMNVQEAENRLAAIKETLDRAKGVISGLTGTGAAIQDAVTQADELFNTAEQFVEEFKTAAENQDNGAAEQALDAAEAEARQALEAAEEEARRDVERAPVATEATELVQPSITVPQQQVAGVGAKEQQGATVTGAAAGAAAAAPVAPASTGVASGGLMQVSLPSSVITSLENLSSSRSAPSYSHQPAESYRRQSRPAPPAFNNLPSFRNYITYIVENDDDDEKKTKRIIEALAVFEGNDTTKYNENEKREIENILKTTVNADEKTTEILNVFFKKGFTGSQLAMGMGVAGLTTGIVGYTVGKKHGKVQNKKGR